MARGGLNYDGFMELFNHVENIQKKHEIFIRNFLLEMGLRVLAQTKKRTPVDTGNLRRNWQLSEVYRAGDTLYIVLWNPAEYSAYIEHGHRIVRGGKVVGWYEGYHMAQISIEQIEKEIPARYEAALQRFIATLGV